MRTPFDVSFSQSKKIPGQEFLIPQTTHPGVNKTCGSLCPTALQSRLICSDEQGPVQCEHALSEFLVISETTFNEI